MTALRWPFSLRMLLREWRGGEIVLLFSALLLGTAIVTGINLFSDRLQKSLVGEASAYLGGDRVLQLSEPLTNEQISEANRFGLATARTTLFPSMAYPASTDSSRTVLSAMKAVSENYPLRGSLNVRKANGEHETLQHGPERSTAWVDNNVLLQLDLKIGDAIDLGNMHFTITRVLLRESDAGSSFYGMGMRVMINDADLPGTGLVLPGSRLEYRYLFTGEESALDSYIAWLKPQLGSSVRVMSLGENQPGIAGALDKAALFLRLAGSLGVLLAALAAGFAAHRYSERHTGTVATLKTLGAGRWQVLKLLTLQMATLWCAATLSGFALGAALQYTLLATMANWVPASLPSAGLTPFFLGATTSLICLLCFIAPAFWRLLATPPWRVLRSEHSDSLIYHRGLWLALPGIATLLLIYSGNINLVLGLITGIGFLLLIVGAAGWLLINTGRAVGSRAGNIWRLGLANLRRRRWFSLLQIVVFGIGFMLLAMMVLLRNSLLLEWQMQIPPDAPNVFLVNIAADEVTPMTKKLQQAGLKNEGFFPMIRGRLHTINGQRATELFGENVSEVYRELNLSWSNQLPVDNHITQGIWPGTIQNGQHPVSIETGLAKKLHIQPGDTLTFTIGDAQVSTYVASVRLLHWDRMTPNFYFLFAPGALENFHATWMTSLYRAETKADTLNQLLREFPTVSAYPVDDLILRLKTIVERASLAVEIILLLALVASMLVLVSCLRASLDQRMQDSALLRTLGASKSIVLGGLAVEFASIGVISGLLAASGAELMGWIMQQRVFLMGDPSLHPVLWLATPLTASLLITSTGIALCYRAVTTPPATILRESLQQT